MQSSTRLFYGRVLFFFSVTRPPPVGGESSDPESLDSDDSEQGKPDLLAYVQHYEVAIDKPTGLVRRKKADIKEIIPITAIQCLLGILKDRGQYFFVERSTSVLEKPDNASVIIRTSTQGPVSRSRHGVNALRARDGNSAQTLNARIPFQTLRPRRRRVPRRTPPGSGVGTPGEAEERDRDGDLRESISRGATAVLTTSDVNSESDIDDGDGL